MSIAALISILADKLIKDSGELWGELLEFLLKVDMFIFIFLELEMRY